MYRLLKCSVVLASLCTSHSIASILFCSDFEVLGSDDKCPEGGVSMSDFIPDKDSDCEDELTSDNCLESRNFVWLIQNFSLNLI